MTSDVDVVMLQCGLPELTVRCIRSIRNTSDANIILVDNGSPRHNVEEVRSLVDRLIENPDNRGFAKAVNQGIEASTGDFVVIQNNDTVVYPEALDRMVGWLGLDTKLGLIGPLTNNANTEQRVFSEQAVRPGYTTTSGLVAFFCTMIPRRVIDHVGLLSEEYGIGYGEDDDYCIRLRRAGYRLGIALDAYVHHDHHATYRVTIGEEGIEAEGAQGLALLTEKYGSPTG